MTSRHKKNIVPLILLSDRRRYVGLFLFLPKEESHYHSGDSAGGRCALRREVECDEMTEKEN